MPLLLPHIRHSGSLNRRRELSFDGQQRAHFAGELHLLDNFLEKVAKNGRLQSRSELRDELLVAGHRFGDHDI